MEISKGYDELSLDKLTDILVSNTPVAYIVLDRDFRIHYINDYFVALRNLEHEKTLGEKCYNLSNSGKVCSVCAVKTAFETGNKERVMRRDILQGGEVRYIDDIAVPLGKDENGCFDYILEIMINRTEEMLSREQLEKDFISLISSLTKLIEAKDKYTATHSQSVLKISVYIASELDLPQKDILDISIAASLHDVGKISIPYSIINKADKLTDSEYSIIKTHSSESFDILDSLSGFGKMKNYVRLHHERYDGKGYPDGLLGKEIPLGAQIMAVADAYDAMTSTRSYRVAQSHETAVAEIKKNSGTQFDPDVVAAFCNIPLEKLHSEKILAFDSERTKPRVERQITPAVIRGSKLKRVGNLDEKIQKNRFVDEIIKNTPAAYAIMDKEQNIVFVSDYFVELMGLDNSEIDGKKCYEASGFETCCTNCPMNKTLDAKKATTAELVRQIKGKVKYLECFAVPYISAETGEEYIIEILMDRTSERELQIELENDFHSIVKMLTQLLSHNDEESYLKSNYIQKICGSLANRLSLEPELKKNINIAATLCDIGMISLGNNTNGGDYDYKKHAIVAYEILNPLLRFKDVASIIKQHHENFDGSGYPGALAGEEIPLGSRMILIADSFYRIKFAGYTDKEVIAKLKEDAGVLYDPKLVDVFVDLYEKKELFYFCDGSESNEKACFHI